MRYDVSQKMVDICYLLLFVDSRFQLGTLRDTMSQSASRQRKLYIMEEETEDAKKSAIDALAQIGMTVEEIKAAQEELEATGSRRDRDNRICACGHRMSAHTVVGGAGFCRPTKMECPCKTPRPVIEAADTRCFNYKTNGSGGLHALARGMLACVERSKRFKWIVPLVCDRCKQEAERLIPSAVSQRGQAMTHATGHDALLCEDCRREV